MLSKGAFHIEKRIVLPKYLSEGEYSLDLIFKQPKSEYQMGARQSVRLHVEGNADAFGTRLNLNQCGLCGLETEQ